MKLSDESTASRSALVLAGVLVIVCAFRHPMITSDTASYLEHSLYRPPLLPIFYDVCRVVFRSRFDRGAVFLQTLFGAWASFKLADSLTRHLGLSAVLRVALLYLFLVPHVQYAVFLSAESVSWSLVLLAFAAALRCLRELDAKAFALVVLWAVLATLARAQMVVLVPFAGLLAFRFVRTSVRRSLLLGVVLGAGLVGGAVLQRVYYRITSGQARATKAAGNQLLTVVLYNTTDEDVAQLSDPADRAYAASSLAQAKPRRLLGSERGEGIPRAVQFCGTYNAIQWDVLPKAWFRAAFDRELTAAPTVATITRVMSPAEWEAFEAASMHASLSLLRVMGVRYAVHVLAITYELFKYYLVLVLLVLGLALARRLDGRMPLLLAATAAMWLANALLVALVEYPMTRYTFYFDELFVAVVFIAIARGLAERGPDVRDRG